MIDETGAKARLNVSTSSPKMENFLRKIEQTKNNKKVAVKVQNSEKAAQVRGMENKFVEDKEKLAQQAKNNLKTKIVPVDVDAIFAVISSWSGVPVSLIEKKNQRVDYIQIQFRKNLELTKVKPLKQLPVQFTVQEQI
jgi:ATP-dependent Clp protease ATP-binding subunit ClpC